MPDPAKVEQLFQAVLEQPSSERHAFLVQATQGDDRLRLEVESRLTLAGAPTVTSSEPAPFGADQHDSQEGPLSDSTLSELPDPLEGKLLSHYRVLQMVGAGGMGVVYRAHDERLDRDVALKVLPPNRLASSSASDHFRKEALALARLNHPHIGVIHDFDREGDVDFLVMEYVPGQTLAHPLTSGPMQEPQVVSLGKQIASALVEAHAKGIVHRDLKPSNIIVTPNGHAKVLDFGVAKLLQPGRTVLPRDQLNRVENRAGTFPYMAPEQLQGLVADARTDIYAAGLILFELATGQRPFRGEGGARSIAELQSRTVRSPRELNPKIQPQLERIILKCLETKPEDRYQSAKDLFEDLDAFEKLSAHRPSLSRRALIVSAAILALIVATYPLWRPKPAAGKVTIAVLPFENVNEDSREEYFCDGLTDEMINRLGRLAPQQLGVIARTSTMRYKNSHKPVDQIGRELGVPYVLEAGVRRSDSRVRISAQLIQVRDQTTLWSQTYEYPLTDVLSLQTTIAEHIAQTLAVQLVSTKPLAKPSSEAYDAYLRGLYHWYKGSAEERKKACDFFERAIQIDPTFAPSYAALANYYSSASALSPKTATEKAKEYALKALALDDSLAQAHAALAGIRFYNEWDWRGAEIEFQRALDLNSNDPETHRMYSNYLLASGRTEEALKEMQRAIELDPLPQLFTSVNEGWSFYFARRYDRAIEQCKKALDLDTDSDGAHACLGWSYLAQGKIGEAIAESERSAQLSGRNPPRLVGLSRAYAAAGRKDAALAVLDEIKEDAKNRYVSPYSLARIYISLGDQDLALAALDRACTDRDPNVVWMKIDSAFDTLHTNARFRDLVRRVGFA